MEMNKPKSTHGLSKITYILHKEYKYKFTKRQFVLEIFFSQSKLEKMLMSLKTEKSLLQLSEALASADDVSNTFTLRKNIKKENTPIDINAYITANEKMTFRDNFKENRPKHTKNRSCEFIDTKDYLTEMVKTTGGNISKPLGAKSNFHFNNGRNCTHAGHNNANNLSTNTGARSKDVSRNTSIDNASSSLLNCSKSPIRKPLPNAYMSSGKTNYKTISKNEANTSLSQIINNMIVESGKAKRCIAKCTDSFIQNDSFSNMIEKNADNSNNKRNKQLSKIIKLTLPNANFGKKENSDNKLNFNNSFTQLDNFDVSDIANDDSIKSIVHRLEAFEEYYCDSFILKKLLSSYGLKKIDLGQVYNFLTKDYLKSTILSEMIAIISKNFLNQSVLKSLEIVLREKEINSNFTINPSHQHSIEYCIVDIFNTFLGNNRESEEFYSKLLAGYLNEEFKIFYILDIKKQISIPNLFVQMQFHNKVYFSENVDINFNDSNPFVAQDIKYISPYYVNKWYRLASDTITVNNANINVFNSTSNVKRMKYNNFEMKESIESTCSKFRENERNNEEYRILLIKNIHFHILNKKSELALKLCDYYVQRYSDTIFLNPIVYIILAEVYNESSGVQLARLFFQKAVDILKWQFGSFENPLLIDMYYTFSLILLKQPDVAEFLEDIDSLLNRASKLCDKFFTEMNDKKVKINLQLCLLDFTKYELDGGVGSLNFNSLIDNIEIGLDYLRKKEKLREESVYLNIFIDLMKNNSNIAEEHKLRFIER
jgi:hypothetical protein